MPRPRTHDWIDERSLALHRAVAAHWQAEPEVVLAKAKANLARWLATVDARSRLALLEWREALGGSRESVVELMTAWDERARRLRQSSPMVAGILPESERRAIFREFRAALEERDEPRRA